MSFLANHGTSRSLLTVALSVATGLAAKAEVIQAQATGLIGEAVQFAAQYSIVIGVVIGLLRLCIEIKNFKNAFFSKTEKKDGKTQ